MLLSDKGQWVAVEEVRNSKDYVKLYNLRVAEWHTYFVGHEDWGFSVWVHNLTCAVAESQQRKTITMPFLVVIRARPLNLGQLKAQHQECHSHKA